MNERRISQQVLEQLLRDAEHAHADYERGLGRPDEDWPAWYAEYIYRQLQPVQSEPAAGGGAEGNPS